MNNTYIKENYPKEIYEYMINIRDKLRYSKLYS